MANELRLFSNYLAGRLLYDLPGASTAVADGVTNGTTTITSATAAFTAADVGAPISGTDIPAGAYIAAYTNPTTVVLSAAATGSGAGRAWTISREKVLHSAALAAAPTVGTTAHLMAGLDPDGLAGAPELVMVTRHDAAATWAQVDRAQDSTVARAHAAGMDWVHGPFASDVDLPAARGYRNAALSPANNVETLIAPDTESYDSHGIFNPANGRLTVPAGFAGIWRFGATIGFSGSAVGTRAVNYLVNGASSSLVKVDPSSSGSTILTVSVEDRFAVGDYVEFAVTQTSGGALALNVGSARATFAYGSFVRRG